MNRRGFLAAMLAAGAAPAIVKAANLMPVFVRRESGILARQDLDFTASDLTLSLEEFSRRYLEPAMAMLAQQIDSDILENVLLYGEVPKAIAREGEVIRIDYPRIVSARYRLET